MAEWLLRQDINLVAIGTADESDYGQREVVVTPQAVHNGLVGAHVSRALHYHRVVP